MRRWLAFATASLLAGPGHAQEVPAADWDLVRDDRQRAIMAYIVFDVGVTISVRCVDGAYDAVVGGLPPGGDRETRPLELTFRDDASAWDVAWNVAVDDTMALSPLPAMLAREMREGGRLQIRVPDGGPNGRAIRYDLELPTSSEAVDATLSACGKPLVDPRDAELAAANEDGLPEGLRWRERPRPRWPVEPDGFSKGFAVVSCLTSPDGSVRDCVIESEHPREAHFGDAVVRSLRSARLEPIDGYGPTPVRRFYFRTNFTEAW